MAKTLIHGDMLIGDILGRYPDAAQIMEDFGLHCTSCSVNAFEPLRAGALSHGMAEETADDLINRLNDMAQAMHKAPKDGLYLTPRAAKMIQEFSEKEEKAGWPLRITAKDNDGMEPAYAMDFIEKAEADDKSFTFHDVTLVLNEESFKNMQGADIDYLDTQFGSGFKITNPQFSKGGCCGGGSCGSGGCGNGACGCK